MKKLVKKVLTWKKSNVHGYLYPFLFKIMIETVLQRCSYEKVFWKYAADLQENNHAEVWFQ